MVPTPLGQDLSFRGLNHVPMATRPGPGVGAPGVQELNVCASIRRRAKGSQRRAALRSLESPSTEGLEG